MGTSHVVGSIYPSELWNDYGIVSYNCGGNANMLPVTYHFMKNVLNLYEPKLMVIDVYCVDSDNKMIDGRMGVECQHISFDWLPLSREKIEAINYLFDDWQTRMEFLFPLSIYHERWTELEENDFSVKLDVTKGASYVNNYSPPFEYPQISQDDYNLSDSLGKQYLCNMIEECQARGIEVLLINIPYPATEELQQWANSVQVIADSYGVDYLNMQYEDTGVNLYTDCADENSHLNASGGRKVTDYLGAYIREHYDIPDRRSEDIAEDWNADYREFAAYKWQLLNQTREDPETYLALVQDQNLDICLYLKGGSELMQSESVIRMIENLGNLEKLQSACDAQMDYLMVIDRETAQISEYVGDEAVEHAASFETISLSEKLEDGTRDMEVSGIEGLNLLAVDAYNNMADLMVITYDKATKSYVDWAKFVSSEEILGS
jgi:hypothetical protein